jgi:UDP-N-acetylglucosamine 2-epimerase
MHSKLLTNNIDYVLIVGDRMEMAIASMVAFHMNVPIIHVYAGVKNNISTLDDINRHCITLWSDIQLVESKECEKNVKKLFKSIGKEPHCKVVGITHLDDLVLDHSKRPSEEYNIVLYNPTTLRKENLIFIGANEDTIWYESLPRTDFLGLLEGCNKFYTNSSCSTYEAPYFLKKRDIITLGERNKNRTKLKKKNIRPGGSKKIVEVLKNELCNIDTGKVKKYETSR